MYPTGFFACKDGFVCIASQTPKQWEAFLALMDNPKWAKEGQAGNAVYLGLVDSKPADKHFRGWLMEYTREELLAMAVAEGIIMGVAQTVDEVLDSEQYAFRDLWGEIELGGKTVRVPKPGYLLAKTPTRITRRGPALDADGPTPAREPSGCNPTREGNAKRSPARSKACACSTSAGTGPARWRGSCSPTSGRKSSESRAQSART